MKQISNIKDAPNFNPEVKNGLDSVSTGKVYYGICTTKEHNRGNWKCQTLPTIVCKDHGAMLCVGVDEDGKIWRCPACNEGAYETIKEYDPSKPQPRCPKCSCLCKKRMIQNSVVYDCSGCKDQIAGVAVNWLSDNEVKK